MLVPMSTEGTQDTIPSIAGYEWIQKLPNKKIYFALFQGWPQKNLPSGYDYYIVSFHYEAVDINWLKQQKITGVIIVLSDGQSYGLTIPGVHFLPFFYWHYQLKTMQAWHGVKERNVSKYKFSAVCHRISQSKIWSTTKLLESASESSLIALSSWLDEKNVHNWQDTGCASLDKLTKIFKQKYLGQTIKIDNFDSATQNYQKDISNPWQPLYTECAVHFSNESFHYSGMQESGMQYTWPGPYITEKTLKCLLAGTAFIPVGQFETYKTLAGLGLVFDYDFDTEWDNDPNNLSRAEKIIDLIDLLNQYSCQELEYKTCQSNSFNKNFIINGKFFTSCENKNNESIEKIYHILTKILIMIKNFLIFRYLTISI
jgi:hypothetical protein